MKPSGSLPCSQEPATLHYHEPHESSPHAHILFFKINFNIIIPFRLGLLSNSSGFPTKTCVLFPATMRAIFSAHFILLNLIIVKHLVRTHIMEHLITQFCTPSCYRVPLTSLRSSNPGSGKRFFSTPQLPDWLWDPPILLSIGYKGLFSGGVQRPWPECNHSQLSNVEVKNNGAIPPLPHMSS
jgi:hypothetical protein